MKILSFMTKNSFMKIVSFSWKLAAWGQVGGEICIFLAKVH